MLIVPTRTQYGAVLDANVLVPAALCDTLLRLAADRFFRPFWSSEILSETERTLVNQLEISSRRARRRVESMRSAFPEATFDNLGDHSFGLPDPNDEHVLATAVGAEAQFIVTFNTRDFPDAICAKEDVQIITPDDFLVAQWSADYIRVRSVIYAQVGALRAPTQGMSNVLMALWPHAPEFVIRLSRSIADDMDELLTRLEIETL